MLAIAAGTVWLGYLLFTYGLSQVGSQNYSFLDLAIPGRFTLGNPAPDASNAPGTPGGSVGAPLNTTTGVGGNPSTVKVCRNIATGENMGPVPASGKCPAGTRVSYLQA